MMARNRVLPKKIRLFGNWVKISTRRRDITTESGQHLAGFFCAGEITVCTMYPFQDQRITLWHEIKHAIEYYLGVVQDGMDLEKLEEEICKQYSIAELTVLRDNPELRQFLFSEGEG